MAAVNTNNTAPDMVSRDINASVDLFQAPTNAQLEENATSGWRRAGATDPGSFTFNPTTSINQRRLGTPSSEVNAHINQQDLEYSFLFQELTPFGNEIRNKTDIEVVDVDATTDFVSSTVAASGGSTTLITLTDATDLKAGHWLRIPLSSGLPAYNDYRYVDSVTGNAFDLGEFPLDEAPADGATITRIVDQSLKGGGSNLKKRSSLGIISGDDGSVYRLHIPRSRVGEGEAQYGNGADIVKNSITMVGISKPELVNGRKQPILFTEHFKPPVVA